MSEVIQNPENNDWYRHLVSECRSLVIEARTASNWVIINSFHAIGTALNSYKEEFGRKGIYGDEVSKRVGKAIGVNIQYVYDAQKFAEMFPDLSVFPGDKAMSWHKCRQKYLMSPEQKKKELKITKCPACGTEF